MIALQEVDPQTLEVFCSNRRCGAERVNTLGLTISRRRIPCKMMYAGSIILGMLDRVLGHFRKYHFQDSGLHHFYSCPMCGNETVYLEKWGVLTRAFCGWLE